MKEIDKLKVVKLQESNFRNIPETLRRIATEIERGELGSVIDVVLVAQGEQFNVYHAGQGDAGSVHLLLACGQRKLEHAVLSQTGGYNLGSD